MTAYESRHRTAGGGDTLTDPERLRNELLQLAEVGCDDVVLYPCSGDLQQVELLVEAVNMQGTDVRSHR